MLSQKGYTYVSLHKSLIYTLHLASILTSLLRQSQELFSNMCLLCLCHVWLWWTHRLSPNSEPLPYGSPTWNLPSSSFLFFLPILKGLTWTLLHLQSLARIPLLWTIAILPSGSTPSRRCHKWWSGGLPSAYFMQSCPAALSWPRSERLSLIMPTGFSPPGIGILNGVTKGESG